MNKLQIDLSNERFHPVWLLVGALIGRAGGLLLGLCLGFWYVADNASVIMWEILGIFAGALFYSFLMTSTTGIRLKGGLLGLGIGLAIAAYGGEIWAMFQHREVRGLIGMTYADGIFFEWVILHLSVSGCFIGWFIGNMIYKKGEKAAG
jgi:hypothetical protein